MNNVCFVGKYDRAKLAVLLKEIEDRFPKVVWGGGSKPSKWSPLAYVSREKYVALELKYGKLTYFINNSESEYEENLKTYMKGVTLITFEEFMNNDTQEIENEMDISFLYG